MSKPYAPAAGGYRRTLIKTGTHGLVKKVTARAL
uniref:Uncharacterized protein n=1 Tax=Anguilla anguilla TaxID=7936 RepID=A0A0E9VCG3_ANGAN